MHFGKYGHEQLAKLFVGKVVPKKKPQCHVCKCSGSTKGNLYLSFQNYPPKEKLIHHVFHTIPSCICKF